MEDAEAVFIHVKPAQPPKLEESNVRAATAIMLWMMMAIAHFVDYQAAINV